MYEISHHYRHLCQHCIILSCYYTYDATAQKTKVSNTHNSNSDSRNDSDLLYNTTWKKVTKNQAVHMSLSRQCALLFKSWRGECTSWGQKRSKFHFPQDLNFFLHTLKNSTVCFTHYRRNTYAKSTTYTSDEGEEGWMGGRHFSFKQCFNVATLCDESTKAIHYRP